MAKKIEIELDDDIAERLGAFCEDTGLDERTLFGLFARKVAREQRVPFEVSARRRASFSGRLKNVDPAHLLSALADADEYTCAAVLPSLDPPKAAIIVQNLPLARQVKIFSLMAGGFAVKKSVAKAIEKSVEDAIAESSNREMCVSADVSDAVAVLNLMDRASERAVVGELEKIDPEVCNAIKERMFVFEDIVLLDDRSVQRILREIDTLELARALVGTDDEVKDKIFRNQSRNAAKMLKEAIDFAGPLDEKEIDERQRKIIGVIRRLEESGDIVIARNVDFGDILSDYGPKSDCDDEEGDEYDEFEDDEYKDEYGIPGFYDSDY